MTELYRLIEVEIPRLRRYARCLARDRARADDLVEAALAEAAAMLPHRPGMPGRAWLFRLVHCAFLSDPARADDPAGGPADAEAPVAPDNLHFLHVGAAFERLPDALRQTLFLVAVEDLSYEETADILMIPRSTVRARLVQAREALRALLGEASVNRRADS